MKKIYKNRLPKNMEASSIYAKVVEGEIIVEVELKGKIQPKDGDLLYLNGCGVFIYKHSIYADCCDAYCGVNCKGRINLGNYTPYWCNRNNFRYATPEEKAAFLERLEKECHKRWNAEDKCLEDIYIPKFGDVVRIEYPDINVFKRNYVISIFPNKKVPVKNSECFFDIATINMDGGINIKDSHAAYNYNHVFLASQSERKELFDKLSELGKRWNSETKQLENIRWRAAVFEGFYFVSASGEVVHRMDDRDELSNRLYDIGNYFKTEGAAQPYADKFKETFKNSKAE